MNVPSVVIERICAGLQEILPDGKVAWNMLGVTLGSSTHWLWKAEEKKLLGQITSLAQDAAFWKSEYRAVREDARYWEEECRRVQEDITYRKRSTPSDLVEDNGEEWEQDLD
jgi:hypothetical protein